MKLVQRSLVGVACVAALFACNKNSHDREQHDVGELGDKSGAPAPGDRVGTTTVTGAELGSMGNDLAAQRIVAARCARETACNNIGPDKHFVDRDVCVHTLGERMSTELQPGECPRGIDGSALDRCMDAIRSESCNNPVETIQRLTACRTGELCVKERTR